MKTWWRKTLWIIWKLDEEWYLFEWFDVKSYTNGCLSTNRFVQKIVITKEAPNQHKSQSCELLLATSMLSSKKETTCYYPLVRNWLVPGGYKRKPLKAFCYFGGQAHSIWAISEIISSKCVGTIYKAWENYC